MATCARVGRWGYPAVVRALALLLVVIIVTLNLTAIAIRNRLREKYNATET